jgi:hypothetical protein
MQPSGDVNHSPSQTAADATLLLESLSGQYLDL